MTGRRSVCVTV